MTIQQKFNAGYVFTLSSKVIQMHTFENGIIACIYESGGYNVWDEKSFLAEHTETPPVHKTFTPIYVFAESVIAGNDHETLEDAKFGITGGLYTCILEHHKVEGKWVFVTAHKIENV